MASFQGSRLKGVRCNTEVASFQGSRLEGVHCNAEVVSFQGSRLEGVHFKGSRLEGVHCSTHFKGREFNVILISRGPEFTVKGVQIRGSSL